MLDQAEKLRELSKGSRPPTTSDPSGPPLIVVSGGRGDVGTSTVAVNLAAVLADDGRRVLAVDAAQQPNDLAEVAGVRPAEIKHPLEDVIAGKCPAADAIEAGPVGVKLLINRWDGASKRDFSRHAQQRLLAELKSIRGVDLVVVDAGSGLTAWTRRFWARAQLVLLVTTSEDAALLNSYAAMKRSAADHIAADVRLLVNQCDRDSIAAEAHHRFSSACRRFLGRQIEAVPPLPRYTPCDSARAAGANRCVPRVWDAPHTPFGHGMLWLRRAVSESLASRELPHVGSREDGPRCEAAATC